MANIKVTTWRPDTCDCEIEYEWDADLDGSVRTHVLKQINKVCEAHKTLSIGEQWNAAMDENTRKNKVLGRVIENFPELTETEIKEDGSEIKQLKRGTQYNWSFDKDRNLEVEITGMTPTQKVALKTVTDSEFGVGKVKIK